MYYLLVIIVLIGIAFLFTNTTETFKPRHTGGLHRSNGHNRRHYRYNNNNNNYGYHDLSFGYSFPLYYTYANNTCDSCTDKTPNDCSMCSNCTWCIKNGSKIETGKCTHINDCI
jgi:hypothetical protein